MTSHEDRPHEHNPVALGNLVVKELMRFGERIAELSVGNEEVAVALPGHLYDAVRATTPAVPLAPGMRVLKVIGPSGSVRVERMGEGA